MAVTNSEQPEIRRCPSIGCGNMVIGSTFCFLHKRETAVKPEHEHLPMTYEGKARARRGSAVNHEDSTGDE